MITKKQFKILSIFIKNTFKDYTFKEIKKLSKEKSNSLIQDAIKVFLKEGLITEKNIGNSKLYKINHDNNKVYCYFEIFIKENLPELVKNSLKILENELIKNTFFYSLVIFGSYASKEHEKNSDLDIAVFIEDENKRKILDAVLNSIKDKSLLNIDGHIITKDEFLEMLKSEKQNLGKEIAKNHLVMSNSRIFYLIINEGIKNGFKL